MQRKGRKVGSDCINRLGLFRCAAHKALHCLWKRNSGAESALNHCGHGKSSNSSELSASFSLILRSADCNGLSAELEQLACHYLPWTCPHRHVTHHCCVASCTVDLQGHQLYTYPLSLRRQDIIRSFSSTPSQDCNGHSMLHGSTHQQDSNIRFRASHSSQAQHFDSQCSPLQLLPARFIQSSIRPSAHRSGMCAIGQSGLLDWLKHERAVHA